MCFIVKKGTEKVQIADKDIICYKTGRLTNKGLISLRMGFLYKKNILYKRRCLKRDKYKVYQQLSIGFHSLISGYGYKFIIPKGSRYLKSDVWHEYISDQIIWKGEKI